MLSSVEANEEIDSYGKKWEFFKFKVREYSIDYGKRMRKQQNELEIQLINDINECCKSNLLDDINKEQLIRLQAKLDELYLNKAKGAYIRSRARWLEDGENIFLFRL